MSTLTDWVYVRWLASHGATHSPRPSVGYGGVPPWKRSETDSELSRSHTSANPAGLAPDADNGVQTDPGTAPRALKNLTPAGKKNLANS